MIRPLFAEVAFRPSVPQKRLAPRAVILSAELSRMGRGAVKNPCIAFFQRLAAVKLEGLFSQ